jgi:hypothetical protein
VNIIQQIQTLLGVGADGVWGPKSQAALDALIHPVIKSSDLAHPVRASSFADPKDVAAFKRCKADGGSDQECFRQGDNAIGCWGDSTAEGSGPSCALPPEDMIEKWGSEAAAKHKPVDVTANGITTHCILKDSMPHRANITNGAGIDLNPDAVRALGLEPPIMTPASWKWA